MAVLPGAAPRGTAVRRVGTDARPDAESATAEGSSGRYNRTVMSIQVAYRDGVFKPLEEVAGAEPGAIYTAFSKEELRDFIETEPYRDLRRLDSLNQATLACS